MVLLGGPISKKKVTWCDPGVILFMSLKYTWHISRESILVSLFLQPMQNITYLLNNQSD